MALEMYGAFIGISVLQAKRIYCRHFIYIKSTSFLSVLLYEAYYHCIQMRDLNP